MNPESKIQDSRSLFWFVAAVAACAVGMGCKEAMVTAPVLVLIFDRVFLARSWRGVLRRRWGLYAGLAGTWSVLAWLLIGSAGSRGSSAGFGHGMAWWQYAVTQFGAILHYLRLSVWPDRLAVDYGAALARGFRQIGPQAAAVAVLGGLTGWGLWRRPGLGFLGAWFFVVLAPSSSVVPLVTQTMAEKRVYLPLAAVVTLAVVSAWWGWGRVSQRAAWLSGRRGRGVGRAAGVAAVVGLAGLLGWRTTVRNVDYRSSLAIWQSAAENAPGNPRAYNNAGRVLLGRGEVRAAMRYFDRALKADRGYAPAWSNRGVALARCGDYDGAIRDLDRSIELDPGEADSFVNRGGVWLDRGDYDRAIADLDEAIRLNPRSAAAFNNRGKAHRAKGERAEAIGDFSAAIRLDGDFADAYCGRALALADGGGLRAAIGDYTRAIELEPGLAAAYSGRGDAWFAAGENDRAIRDYSEAIRLAPTFAVAYNNRGAALLNKGHPEAAVRDCTRAIELAPGFAQANSNRAKALLRLGDYDGAWADVRACLRLGGRIDPRFLDELRRASGRDQ